MVPKSSPSSARSDYLVDDVGGTKPVTGSTAEVATQSKATGHSHCPPPPPDHQNQMIIVQYKDNDIFYNDHDI